MNPNQYSVDINQFLYRNYITYESLYNLNKRAFYGKSDATTVNIFIDIRSLTKKLFQDSIKWEYKDPITPIASSIINIAIHLRHYYLSRHSTFAKIYLVWGSNEICCSTGQIDGYNAHNSMSFNSYEVMKDLIYKNNESMNIICPYLEGIYFINGGQYETMNVIQCLLDYPLKSFIFQNVPNIIYTTDPFNFQLIAINSYTFAFVPKKAKSSDIGRSADVSELVEKKNLYNSYRYMNSWALQDPAKTPPIEWFCSCLALSHCKARHINNIGYFNNICNYINSFLDELPRTSNNFLIANALFDLSSRNSKLRGMKLVNADQIAMYADALDLRETRKVFNASNIAETIFTGIVDLYSPEDLKHINDKYFINYPIDLMRL